MNIALCYFSGTGNTEIVTHILSEHLREKGASTTTYYIPDFFDVRRRHSADRQSFDRHHADRHPVYRHSGERLSGAPHSPDRDSCTPRSQNNQRYTELIENSDMLVLLYPVYGFDAAPNMYRFLHGLPTASGDFPCAIIACPGDPHWMNSASTISIRKRLTKRGFSVFREDMVIMPSNFIVEYPTALSKQLIAAAEKKCNTIAEAILSKQSRFIRPRFFARVLKLVCTIEHLGDNFFGKDLKAGETCTLCGKCVRDCPQKNIVIEKGRVRFGWRCIMCMKCIYRCPQQAITPRLSRFVVIKNGYDPYKLRDTPSEEPFVVEKIEGFYARFQAYLFEDSPPY